MGSYDVTLTVLNATGQSKKYKPGFIQVGPTGIPDISHESDFSIIPNPIYNGKFSVIFRNPSDHEIKLLSSMGVIVDHKTTESKEAAFDIPGITKGLYFIQVKDNVTGQINIQKLIIQ